MQCAENYAFIINGDVQINHNNNNNNNNTIYECQQKFCDAITAGELTSIIGIDDAAVSVCDGNGDANGALGGGNGCGTLPAEAFLDLTVNNLLRSHELDVLDISAYNNNNNLQNNSYPTNYFNYAPHVTQTQQTPTQLQPATSQSIYHVPDNSTALPPVSILSGIYRRSPFKIAADLDPSLFNGNALHEDLTKDNFYENNAFVPQSTSPNNDTCQTRDNAPICETQTSEQLENNHDSLAKLAYNIWQLSREDHIVIDRKNNEVVRTDAQTNQKTIYQLRDPILMGMKPPQLQHDEVTPKPKIRRPRKRLTATQQHFELNSTKLIKMQAAAAANQLNENRQNTKGVQQTNGYAAAATTSAQQENQLRTRFGRVVRYINPIMPYKSVYEPNITSNGIHNGKPTTAASETAPIHNENVTDISEMFDHFVADLRDKDYRPKAQNNLPQMLTTTQQQEANNTTVNDNTTKIKAVRFVPPQSICPTCHKVFLGRRMERHFGKFPEHKKEPQQQQQQQPINLNDANNLLQNNQNHNNNNNNTTLFNFLIAKLQRNAHLNEEQRADFFLNELNDFIEQLQLRSTRLIRNTSGLHFVNARTARVLSIPEGQYALDMSAIESMHVPEPETDVNMLYEPAQTLPVMPPRNLVDYTTALSMSLDDTLTDEAAQKLNLSAGGKLLPPSEESLLRTVGDFLQDDGIGKLDAVNLLQPPMVVNNVNGAVSVSDAAVASNINTHNGADLDNVGNGVSDVSVSVNDATSVDVNDVNVNALLPHYVHVSDNAVEAVNMKETPNTSMIDFFQFNKN